MGRQDKLVPVKTDCVKMLCMLHGFLITIFGNNLFTFTFPLCLLHYLEYHRWCQDDLGSASCTISGADLLFSQIEWVRYSLSVTYCISEIDALICNAVVFSFRIFVFWAMLAYLCICIFSSVCISTLGDGSLLSVCVD